MGVVNFQYPAMNKILTIAFLLLVTSGAIGQVIGRVDKKTKEFTVAPDQKTEYRVYGYQFANNTTRRMICFSSSSNDVQANYAGCPLGSYYDTNRMKPGDKILYLGQVGTFAKMNYVTSSGTKTIFFLPKNCFVIK
jgi:hypothetical protein